MINDIDQLAKPISYVSFKVKSNDGKTHDAQVYFGVSTDLAVNVRAQTVTTTKYASGDLSILKAGTAEELAGDEQVRRVYLGKNFELREKKKVEPEIKL